MWLTISAVLAGLAKSGAVTTVLTALITWLFPSPLDRQKKIQAIYFQALSEAYEALQNAKTDAEREQCVKVIADLRAAGPSATGPK